MQKSEFIESLSPEESIRFNKIRMLLNIEAKKIEFLNDFNKFSNNLDLKKKYNICKLNCYEQEENLKNCINSCKSKKKKYIKEYNSIDFLIREKLQDGFIKCKNDFLKDNIVNNYTRDKNTIPLNTPEERFFNCEFILINKLTRRLKKYWIDRLNNKDKFFDVID